MKKEKAWEIKKLNNKLPPGQNPKILTLNFRGQRGQIINLEKK
jgi:hypothetical protein